MNWNNLKSAKCPQCGFNLTHSTFDMVYKCMNDACKPDFKISNEKFESIVNSLYKPQKRRTEDENLADLNNLGRKEITEDFSDSHFLD